MVRFPAMLQYRPYQGSDHFVSLREADCTNRSFRDITLTYYIGQTIVRTEGKSSGVSRAARGTVDDEMILAACGVKPLGKMFDDPYAASRIFFAAK